jgi:hypothetical protein
MPESQQYKPAEKWKDSRAKKKLTKDILSGKVPPEWKPKRVLATRSELYKPYEKNFGNNLRNLRKSLIAQQDRADEDDAAVWHDLNLFPRSNNDPRGYPRWHGSAAQRLLKEDISAGKHIRLLPREIQKTRDEYKLYPLKVFSDHICQEKTSRHAKSYWLSRQKKQKGQDDENDNSM